jgi:hypothetical protein
MDYRKRVEQFEERWHEKRVEKYAHFPEKEQEMHRRIYSLDEAAPHVKPVHGDTWGRFTFDREVFVLRHTLYGREIDLEDCTSSARAMDWIFQISNKTWMSTEDRGQLLEALQDLLRPQANLCSFGRDRYFKNIREYLLAHTGPSLEKSEEILEVEVGVPTN